MPSCSGCLVLGCLSNTKVGIDLEGHVRMFSFPSVPERSKPWTDAIFRPGYKPCFTAKGVCEKHFQKSDFVYAETYKNKEGDICEFTLPKPLLKRTAVPSIFIDTLIEDMSEEMRELTRKKVKKDLKQYHRSITSGGETSIEVFEKETFKQPAAKVFRVSQ